MYLDSCIAYKSIDVGINLASLESIACLIKNKIFPLNRIPGRKCNHFLIRP